MWEIFGGKLAKPNALVWSSGTSAHAKHGKGLWAIDLYDQMHQSIVKPDGYIFVSILKVCASKLAILQGQLIHAQIIDCGFDSNIFVGSALINMYVKCGGLEDGQRVFDRLPRHDLVTWNAMIAGYAQYGPVEKTNELFQKMQKDGVQPNNVTLNAMIAGYAQHGLAREALQFFQQMQQEGWNPDDITYASILKACTTDLEDQEKGKLLHVLVIEKGLESDVFVGNTLINMYVKFGYLKGAYGVFKRLPKQDCVTWNIMIAGYALHGHGQEALNFFQQMQWNGHKADNVTWNAMLTGYVQHGQGQEALDLFQQMQLERMKPDNVTIVSILKACSSLGAVDQGKLAHAYVMESGFNLDLSVANTLIDMYIKCGSLDNACRVFEILQMQDLVTWNSLIAGYSLHRKYDMALKCFENMQKEGFEPDRVTFACILSACNHGGLVEKGCFYFKSMKHHSILPKLEHYNCMVDLLGREGYLKEAETILTAMPLQPDIHGWTSLLNHCRTYGNVDLGRRCFDHVISMDGKYASGYMLMSSIYVDADMWEDAEEIQQLRRCANTQKPGQAFIGFENKVHGFAVEDTSHLLNDKIYAKLNRLCKPAKEDGRRSLFLPMPDDLRNASLCAL